MNHVGPLRGLRTLSHTYTNAHIWDKYTAMFSGLQMQCEWMWNVSLVYLHTSNSAQHHGQKPIPDAVFALTSEASLRGGKASVGK